MALLYILIIYLSTEATCMQSYGTEGRLSIYDCYKRLCTQAWVHLCAGTSTCQAFLLLSPSYAVIMYQNSTTYILYLLGHNTSTPKTAMVFSPTKFTTVRKTKHLASACPCQHVHGSQAQAVDGQAKILSLVSYVLARTDMQCTTQISSAHAPYACSIYIHFTRDEGQRVVTTKSCLIDTSDVQHASCLNGTITPPS